MSLLGSKSVIKRIKVFLKCESISIQITEAIKELDTVFNDHQDVEVIDSGFHFALKGNPDAYYALRGPEKSIKLIIKALKKHSKVVKVVKE